MKIHYVNLGMARNATTWLFHTLMQSEDIDYTGKKEPDISLFNSIDAYEDYYKHYQVGLNFKPNAWMLDSQQLSYLNQKATHQSIIFRNPYDFANSLYNFWNSQQVNNDDFITAFSYYFNYTKILNRLSPNILILLYDNIVNQPQQVVNQLTDYLEISPVTAISNKINKTRYSKELIFNNKNIKILNDEIERFQDYINVNLSHWITNVQNKIAVS